MKKQIKGSVSIENLHHFNCGSCKKWWSVGDAEKLKKEWFCPWCGVLQKVENIKPHIKRKY